MQFNRKQHSFDSFDGKVILTAIIDFPVGGAGIDYEYLNRLTNNCFKFVSTGFYDKLRSKYISEYHNRYRFAEAVQPNECLLFAGSVSVFLPALSYLCFLNCNQT